MRPPSQVIDTPSWHKWVKLAWKGLIISKLNFLPTKWCGGWRDLHEASNSFNSHRSILLKVAKPKRYDKSRNNIAYQAYLDALNLFLHLRLVTIKNCHASGHKNHFFSSFEFHYQTRLCPKVSRNVFAFSTKDKD
jgi:hypothetical protein